MSDSVKYPPQQGHAWRGDWKERIRQLLATRGFSSMKSFIALDHAKSFEQLANELGPGDVAAIQLQWLLLDEAHAAGELERVARDLFVRTLREHIPDGWPPKSELAARKRLASGLAAWSSSISSQFPEYRQMAIGMAAGVLDDPIQDRWMPTDSGESIVLDIFRRYWKESA
ncbi:MAG: hypothetical protein HC863_00530 [Myxococcales bacterium]|nr:hypothetical protein [Myxococcales bacterium]